MPISLEIEKDYLYNLGLKKFEEKLQQAKELTEKITKEKAELKERARVEKAKLEAKERSEKAKLEAKARLEKKVSIQKLKIKNKFSDEEIMEILSLDKKTYEQYVKEINEEQKK